MNIAVLGCGPSGLLAAHVAVQNGHHVEIFSEKKKSVIGGAQYLHSPVDDITDDMPDGYVAFMKMGSREVYADKVYGDMQAPVSWDNYRSEVFPAWSMVKAYDMLWDHYEQLVQPTNLDPDQMVLCTEDSDMVISSIPKPALCYKEHQFNSQRIVLAPYSLIHVDNVVIYSGRTSDSWYRTSKIFGEAWTEFALRGDEAEGWPGILGQVKGIKPTSNDCDCHPDIVNIGRFGRWEKGVLVHHAIRDAELALRYWKDTHVVH